MIEYAIYDPEDNKIFILEIPDTHAWQGIEIEMASVLFGWECLGEI